jgi:hypothetical protein
MTTFDTDPDTRTVAAAWAACPVNPPADDTYFESTGVADVEPAEANRRAVNKHAVIALVAFAGIGAGTALGLMSADFTTDQPSVIVPATDYPVVLTPHSQTLPPTGVAPRPGTAPAVVAPSTAEVSTPPTAPAQSTVVDVPAPQAPAPEVPADQGEPKVPEDQEEPAPQPPVFDPELPKAPAPQPKPQPPVFDPNLPKAPAPQPQPDPKPQPELDIKAGPNP